MTCNEVEERLLALDHGEIPGVEVEAHLSKCPSCRRLARTLAVAEGGLRETSRADPDLVNSVMTAIDESNVYPTRAHSFFHWLFGGLLLVTAFVAVRQSDPFRFLLDSFLGPRVDLSVTVVIGMGVVAYLAVFVVANGDRLEEVVRSVVRRHGSGER